MGKSVKQEERIAGKWVRVSLGVTLGRNKNKYLDVRSDEKHFRVLTLLVCWGYITRQNISCKTKRWGYFEAKMVTKNSSSSSSICFCKVDKMGTYEEGGVLEGGGLRRALAVHRHPSLERRGFADVAR